MPRLIAQLLAVACLLPGIGCRDLPNPETDELTRVMRIFDRMQRPSGLDLPVERYFAWSSKRDAGTMPAADLTEDLQGLTDVQRGLVVQIKRIRTTSDVALSVLDAYLAAHIEIHLSLEEVLTARRLSDEPREKRGEDRLRAAYSELRRARARRRDLEKRLAVGTD